MKIVNTSLINEREQLYLSLSPFTIIDLFHPNIQSVILPYLTSDRKKIYPKGHIFYETGGKASSLFYLNKGISIESIMNENGLEKDFMIIPPYPLGFHYCAHEQPIFPCTKAFTECEVYQFAYDEFLDIMQKDKKLLKAILNLLSLDFRLANSPGMQNYSLSSYEKICQTILSYFIGAKYNKYMHELKLTQELIAALTGVHRISAVRAIQKLKEENIITYENKRMTLLDYNKLCDIAYGKYPIK